MAKKRHAYDKLLLELTSLPTASGREGAVIAYVEKWIGRRRGLVLKRDRHHNLLIQRRGARSRTPLILTAHMDHPAFVVREVVSSTQVIADFRGGVHDEYFEDSQVLLFHGKRKPATGTVHLLQSTGEQDRSQRVMVEFASKVKAGAGDVLMWDTGPVRIEERDGVRLLVTRACDDLAGVAAALATLDELAQERDWKSDVRVLLTRAEEIAFIGAMAACSSGIIPRGAQLINIENSRSYAESPQGAGPIVRVGDRTSTFDPDLTYKLSQICQQLAGEDERFKFQRKLMPGGTCEASAFKAFGYAATGVCLPLGNYHNMDETKKRIGPEFIDLGDFESLVTLLVQMGLRFDDSSRLPDFKSRLDALYRDRKHVLREPV